MSKTIDNTNLVHLVQLIKNYIISKVSEHVKDVSINGTTITVTHDDDTTETLTTQDTVTTATTSGSGNAVTAVTASNGQLTVTKGNSFLPTSGGTMDGTITTSVQQIIKKNDNTSSVQLLGGTSSDDGAYLRLEGQTGSYTGNFRIVANDSSSGTRVSAVLQGTPAGSLTWKGNELATDNNVVHLTGTEDITGKKTIASNLNIKNANLTRGTNPASNSWIYMSLSGSGGDATNQRFGTVASGVYTTGAVRTYLEAYKNTADTTTNAQLSVTYPASGDPYASAPSTPDKSVGTEIVTADFLNGVANQAISKSQVDLNTIVDQGIYYVTGTVANHNFPIGTNGILTVLRSDSTAGQGFVQQYFRRTGTAGTNDHMIYVRECGLGGTGTWGGWKQLMTSNNVVKNTGSVSQPVYIDSNGVTQACTTTFADDSGVVHTTGDETIAGSKSFTGTINIADGAGITFTNNGVTQRLISTTPNLQSVEGNNAVSLRLGYGGSTYVTGGECAGYITTDNGFAYSNENVQLMADSNIYLRTGLNSGWNADLGAVATNAAFRPIADGGMTLGTASYRWGNAYIGTAYMNGSIVFDETATISGTSTRHLANISMNNNSLNFGAYDQTNSKWIWWATPAGVNTFNGNAATATKATQDGDGNVISTTYVKNADAVHKSGDETITGTKTFYYNGAQAKDSNLTRGSTYSARSYEFFSLVDSANKKLGGIYYQSKADGGCFIALEPYQLTSSGNAVQHLGIGFNADGTVYTETHTPDTTDNSDQIASTSFVQTHVANKINVSGSRGDLAGYQTPLDQAKAFTINYNTRDIVNLTAAVKVTVTNSAGSSAAWIKYVFIHNAGATIALGSSWHWKDSTTPTVSANSVLVLMWCKTFGIAELIK